MKPYDILLFDADGTLLDFKKTEKKALQQVFCQHEILLNSHVETLYKEINQKLWRDFEKGLISRETVVHTRFQILFDQLGIAMDGSAFEDDYRLYLNRGCDLIDGALEVCRLLSRSYPLYIVTNGTSQTQYLRLRDSGLSPFFQDIFVSEDAGYQKPMVEYFNYVFSKLPKVERSRVLIVGDSLSSDILGGNRAGIDTCWYNPERLSLQEGFRVTLEIQSLKELNLILREE